jgi:hypothetical protein
MTKTEKDFLVAHHKAMAEHSVELGKCFQKSSEAHGALAKSMEMTTPDASASHEDIANSHKDAAASCVKSTEHSLDCAARIEAMAHSYGTDGSHNEDSDMKAVLAELRKLTSGATPSGVSAVPRFDRNTLVPRTGQPQLSDIEAAKAALPPELKDVIFDSRQARD